MRIEFYFPEVSLTSFLFPFASSGVRLSVEVILHSTRKFLIAGHTGI
jgi:hypothetical protein